jgi:hypothetical protein
VAPASRCASLLRHAFDELGLSGSDHAITDHGVTVSITAWEALLDAIASGTDDGAAIHELEQLRGLFTYLSRGALLAVDSEDVSSRRGQINYSIWKIAEGTVDELMRSPRSSVRVYSSRSKGGGFWGAGAYLVLGEIGAWFGVHLPLWARHSETPYWLQFKGWDAIRGNRLARDLEAEQGVITAFHRLVENDVVVALTPPIGAEETEAINRLLEHLVSISQILAGWGDEAPAPVDDAPDDPVP